MELYLYALTSSWRDAQLSREYVLVRQKDKFILPEFMIVRYKNTGLFLCPEYSVCV
jgi:hypothetical protein